MQHYLNGKKIDSADSVLRKTYLRRSTQKQTATIEDKERNNSKSKQKRINSKEKQSRKSKLRNNPTTALDSSNTRKNKDLSQLRKSATPTQAKGSSVTKQDGLSTGLLDGERQAISPTPVKDNQIVQQNTEIPDRMTAKYDQGN